jgi:ankyrin repeat protein
MKSNGKNCVTFADKIIGIWFSIILSYQRMDSTVDIDALWTAVARNDVTQFRKLLGSRNAAEIHNEGEPLLHFASKQRNTDILELLLRLPHMSPDLKDDLGWTPLLLACFDDQLPAIRVLLSFNADPNVRTSKLDTPLHIAAYRGRGEIVNMLLEHGADTSLLNAEGKTALQLAQETDVTAVVDMLRQHDDDDDKKNRKTE